MAETPLSHLLRPFAITAVNAEALAFDLSRAAADARFGKADS
jgi:hypothetical protein